MFFVFYFSGNREKHVRNAPTAFCVEKYKRTRLFSVMSRAREVEDKHAIPFIRQGTSNSVVEVQEHQMLPSTAILDRVQTNETDVCEEVLR